MVEVVGVEFIDDALTCGARADEWVDLYVLTEKRAGEATHLVGVVLAD